VTGSRARWAVLGSSAFATEWIAPAVRASSRGTLEAIISRDPAFASRIADKLGAPIAVTSISELAADSVDVVHIVAPNELHEPLTLEAASRGLSILVEKPMAPSVASARRMADAARGAGVLLAVGHCMAWAPPVVRAAEAIRDGSVGTVVSASIAASFDSPPAGQWPQLRPTEDGGGPLQDLGPHMVDAMLRLGASPSTRGPRGQGRAWPGFEQRDHWLRNLQGVEREIRKILDDHPQWRQPGDP
jgi:1,5-anhydro-D-fructose reductase (1,5-anhydro-D-mannitol-forming)